VRIVEEAHKHYQKRNYDLATLKYLFASEMGLEMAQINAAYLIENGCSPSFLPTLISPLTPSH